MSFDDDDSGNFYYFSICHFCKNEFDELKRCSSCKAVFYCSKAHQTLDWKKHKELCRAITIDNKLSEDAHNKVVSFEDWKHYRVCRQKAWVSILNRALKGYECQMWMFPQVCNVCFTKRTLSTCRACKNVSYCSYEHLQMDKPTHDLYCEKLRLCLEVDRYLAKNNSYPEIQLKQNIFNQSFPVDIEHLLDLTVKEKVGEEHVTERVLKTDILAPGAIILYALKISGVTQTLRDELNLHIVGSSSAEGTSDWQIATELIFHWIPNLKRIIFTFIGPEAWDISTYKFNLCQTCQDNKRSLKVKVYKQLYHNVIDIIEKPNLIISLNSGLHEFQGQSCDQWQRSIPMLLACSKVPFVFTSYTEEEMLRDLQRIRDSFGNNVIVLICGKNQYASLRPNRDWCTKDIPIFYSSGYISIVKKK